MRSAGGRRRDRRCCNTNSPSPPPRAPVTLEGCPSVLLCLDPKTTETKLVSGELRCPTAGCPGRLRPWGRARDRVIRLAGHLTERHTPRRARCRACRRTQVLVPARTFPRRSDAVETVASALVAAAEGLGHRRVAVLVGRPPTTVRDWIRRARANSEVVRAAATVATCEFDPMAGPFVPRATPLGDMLESVGRAVSAAVCRLGPVGAPWQLAVVITRAGILTPRLRPARASSA